MKLRKMKLRIPKADTETYLANHNKIMAEHKRLNPIYDTMFEETYGKEMVSNFWKLGDYEIR